MIFSKIGDIIEIETYEGEYEDGELIEPYYYPPSFTPGNEDAQEWLNQHPFIEEIPEEPGQVLQQR